MHLDCFNDRISRLPQSALRPPLPCCPGSLCAGSLALHSSSLPLRYWMFTSVIGTLGDLRAVMIPTLTICSLILCSLTLCT